MKRTVLGALVLFVIAALIASGVEATSTGSASGSSFASVAFGGSDDGWTGTGNAAASDNSRADSSLESSGEDTEYLRATDFGFVIPSGSTIDGIEVSVERSRAGASNNIRDHTISLVKNDVVVGSNKADFATIWPTNDAVATYGSPSDLWGTTWTAADINDPDFGAAVAAEITSDTNNNARVDHITITVYYTIPSTGGSGDDSATAEFLYNVATSDLSVQGYAPTGSLSANITLTGATSSKGLCVAVTQGSDPEFSGTFNTTTWANETYFLNVDFFDAASCAGSAVSPDAFGGEFDLLAVRQLSSSLASAQANIAAAQAQLDSLQANFTGNVSALQAQLNSLQTQINTINLELVTVTTDIDALEIQVTGLIGTVAGLQSQIDALNHATLSLQYSTSGGTFLYVWGEAPAGAVSAIVLLRETDGTIVWQASPAITTNGQNENTYTQSINLAGFPLVQYTVEVDFYNSSVVSYDQGPFWMPEYMVFAPFDNLAIEGIYVQLNALNATLGGVNATLQAQIDDLYFELNQTNADVAALQAQLALIMAQVEGLENDVSAEFTFDGTSALDVQGYGPFSALSAKVQLFGQTESHELCAQINQTGAPEYTATFTTTGWAQESYRLTTTFYNDTSCGASLCAATPTTAFADDLSTAANWATFVSANNGFSRETNDNSNCINDGNDDCIRVDSSSNNGDKTLSMTSDVDLSACAAGSAQFRIARVDTDGTLEANDCVYVLFSNNSGGSYGSQAQIVCNDQAIFSFATSIPDAYLVSGMRARLRSTNFGASGEEAYLDDISITCDVVNACTDVQPRAFGGEFDALLHAKVQAQIAQLNASIANNTASILALQAELDLVWGNISLLQDDVSDLQDAVEDLEARLYGVAPEGTVWNLVNGYCISDPDLSASCTLEEFCADLNEGPSIFNFLVQLDPDAMEALGNFLGTDNQGDLNTIWNACQQVQIGELYNKIYGDTPEQFIENSREAFCELREAEADFQGVSPTSSVAYRRYCTNAFGDPAMNWADNAANLGLEDRINRVSQISWQSLSDLWTEMDYLWDFLDDYLSGFDETNERVYEVYNQAGAFARPMNFQFKPAFGDDGGYGFELRMADSNNGEDITQELVSCAAGGRFMDSFDQNQVRVSVDYPQTAGRYRVRLRAIECAGGTVYDVSDAFIIRVVDLAFPWPENTLVIGNPIPQAALVNYTSNDVFWTSSNIVPVDALLGSDEGWQAPLGCAVSTYKSTTTSVPYELWDFASVAMNTTCEGEIAFFGTPTNPGIADLGYFQPGVNKIKVCAHPVRTNGTAVDYCDDVKLGFDNEAPVIVQLYPAETDAVRGTVTFSASITDNGALSVVEFSLLNKTDNATLYGPYLAFYNATSTKWESVVNTTAEAIVDGAYNLKVEAQDYAGNSAQLVIDPIIDNTAPVVVSVTTPGVFLVGLDNVVSARVTDNLAGVDDVNATLSVYTCGASTLTCDAVAQCGTGGTHLGNVSLPLSMVSGTSLDGVWSASVNLTQFLGNLTGGVFVAVEVTASDATTSGPGDPGNVNVTSAGTLNAHEGYVLDIASAGPNPVITGQAISVSGSLVAASGVDLSGENVTVDSTVTTVLLNSWPTVAITAGGAPNVQVITATYKSACNDTFTDTASVSVEPMPLGGGGGGGGGGSASGDCNEGYERVDGKCVRQDDEDDGDQAGTLERTESDSPATQEQSGSSGTDVESSAAQEPQEEAQPEADLVTGAVTGNPLLANWPWLVGVLALIGLALGGYFLTKKK